MYCEICKKETEYSVVGFTRYHLQKEHNIGKNKQYYDLYCKKNDEDGKCKVCGEETHFNGILKGYSLFCSNACSLLDDGVYKQKVESAKRRRVREQKKYGGKIFLQTKECTDKIKATKKERYGDEKYCNVDKIKTTKQERYGDASYCNTKKIRRTMLSKYGGFEQAQQQYAKSMKKKYGVDNYFKTKEFRESMEARGQWISLKKLSKYELYKRKVRSETKRWKKQLYENWDGRDYYTGKKLVTYAEWKKIYPNINVSNNKLQPSIDHKISVTYGFIHNISYKIIGNIKNLCICSREINVTKNYKTINQYNQEKGGSHGRRKQVWI